MRNEKTGKRASTLAARLLAGSKRAWKGYRVVALRPDVALGVMEFLSCIGLGGGNKTAIVVDLGDIEEFWSVCGSDLTQAPDKRKS